MSYEVMSSAIENFYAATEGAASRVIAFHGGEPLLHYGEILRVVRLGNIGEDFFPMIPSCEGWREIRSYKLQNLTGCKKCTLIKTCPAGCSVRCYYSNDSVHSTDPLCGFYKLILPYLDDTGLAKKIYNIYVN